MELAHEEWRVVNAYCWKGEIPLCGPKKKTGGSGMPKMFKGWNIVCACAAWK